MSPKAKSQPANFAAALLAEAVLPVALVAVWPKGGARASNLREAETRPFRPGVLWLESDLCAVLPVAGDAAVFDTALTLVSELLTPSAGGSRVAPEGSVLIFPGRVFKKGSEVRLDANPLVEAVRTSPPALPLGSIVMTSHAALRLETPRQSESAGYFEIPSGERVPLLRVRGLEVDTPAGRNPSFLRRRTPYLDRPAVAETLVSLPWRSVLSGPLGSGKSRAVWETLNERKIPSYWVTAHPDRQGGPSLAAQLVFRLLTSPRYEVRAHTLNGFAGLGEGVLELAQAPTLVLEPDGLAPAAQDPAWLAGVFSSLPKATGPEGSARPILVIDDADSARRGERQLIDALLKLPETEGGPAILLIRRPVASDNEAWSALPQMAFPAWTAAEMEALLESLAAGLALPMAVRSQLLQETAGCPFALEESLIALVHEGLIRQVYGSFFFRGGDVGERWISDRLRQHAYSEAERLGSRLPVAALAETDTPAPAIYLSGLAAEAGEPLPPDWQARLLRTGWLVETPTPWGPGLALAAPILGTAVASTYAPAARRELRAGLGRLLPTAVPTGAWQRYRLLGGSELGPQALLEVIDSEHAPPEQLAEALSHELAALRARGGEEALELELLRHLLPLTHRLGLLRDHKADVERARQLAARDPRRYLAFSALKAEIAELEGHLPEAEAVIREALQKAGSHEEHSGALLVVRLGRLLLRQERADEAQQLFEKALPVLESSGAPSLAATCQFYLGNVALHQGRFEDALDLHQKALERRRRQGKPRSIGISLSALGRVHLLLGRFPESLACYQQAEQIFLELGEEEERSFALLGTGLALSRIGDFAAASAPLRRALLLREKAHNTVGEAIARLAVAENYLQLNQLDSALSEARRSLFDLQLLPGRSAVVADAHQLLGRVLLALRRYEEAERALSEALAEHQRFDSLEAAALDLAWWLESAIARNDDAEIRRLLDQLAEVLKARASIGQREVLEYRLFQAHRRLAQSPEDQRYFLRHLRRAYQELLRKASYLDRDKRHFYLFRVPEHQAILAAASEHGLSMPDLPSPLVGGAAGSASEAPSN